MSDSPRSIRRRKPADPALVKVLQAAGTSHALALALGLTPARISQWHRVPPKHALAIEQLFGVSKSLTAPEFYPPTEEQAGTTVAA